MGSKVSGMIEKRVAGYKYLEDKITRILKRYEESEPYTYTASSHEGFTTKYEGEFYTYKTPRLNIKCKLHSVGIDKIIIREKIDGESVVVYKRERDSRKRRPEIYKQDTGKWMNIINGIYEREFMPEIKKNMEKKIEEEASDLIDRYDMDEGGTKAEVREKHENKVFNRKAHDKYLDSDNDD